MSRTPPRSKQEAANRPDDAPARAVPSDIAQKSLARGAAIITVATAASRVTGFIRVVVVAWAMGTTFLANTYQTANTAPNLVFELVAAGALTSIFVPTFVEYLASDRRREGWHAANALTSVALVVLLGLSALVALAAPLIMQALTLGVADDALRADEIALGSTFLRLFALQITLYGAGMIMTSALHAHRRFAMPAIAPIFNNVVVIGVYLAYAVMRGGEAPSVDDITAAETFLLGAGTTLGVVAMTVCLIPQLRGLGWRFRFSWNPSHPAVRKGARIGAWALGYAGGYQVGLIVVLILANRVEGGVAAYQWAYTFFYMPHALFAVPVFNVLFTAMSEHVAKGERTELLGRLRDGLRMLAFILLPISALMLATAEPVSQLTLEYGSMTPDGASLVARVLAAFAVGLPAYSAFLVFTRGYYALGDTRTPALVNAGTIAFASGVGVIFFFTFSDDWSVPGLALGHSLGFIAGSIVMTRLFSRQVGSIGSTKLSASLMRSLTVALVALVVMFVVRSLAPEGSKTAYLVNFLLTAGAGAAVYLGGMHLLRAPELKRLFGIFPERSKATRRRST
jgi:putative peptidoglycan lipid II flippase